MLNTISKMELKEMKTTVNVSYDAFQMKYSLGTGYECRHS